MQRLVLTLCVGVLVVIVPVPSNAEPVVVTMCPAVNSQNPEQNFAIVPGFENCSIHAQTSCEGKKRKGSCELLPTSPVTGWKMHSDKSGSKVTAKCVPIAVSEKNDERMLKVVSNDNKSGVFLELPNLKSDARRIHSTWVWVRSGQVTIARQGGNTRPASSSTKVNGWEQPRICTNKAMPTDSIVIDNQVKG
ncbi:hypothetical protein [Nitrosomonas sp. Is37]|uniref:hypothetical protein n=1 Tax=Nitrosomonas sp. Is37 TaxID=3080535 RepID=UPI00294B1ADB|nr:hypothetical protein [Nitrosomonas sp. Is37]MDV6344230.1 hypothetical protein [Nitrosomonas sp. Is37]